MRDESEAFFFILHPSSFILCLDFSDPDVPKIDGSGMALQADVAPERLVAELERRKIPIGGVKVIDPRPVPPVTLDELASLS